MQRRFQLGFRSKRRHHSTGESVELAGSREVGIVTVGSTFDTQAKRWPGDGELTPAIVAPGGPTVSAAISSHGEGESEINGVLNVGAQSAGFAESDLAIQGEAVASGSLASGSLSDEEGAAELVTSPESTSPPVPAPQGGRWYGKSVTFAASGEGSFHYLSPRSDEADN